LAERYSGIPQIEKRSYWIMSMSVPQVHFNVVNLASTRVASPKFSGNAMALPSQTQSVEPGRCNYMPSWGDRTFIGALLIAVVSSFVHIHQQREQEMSAFKDKCLPTLSLKKSDLEPDNARGVSPFCLLKAIYSPNRSLSEPLNSQYTALQRWALETLPLVNMDPAGKQDMIHEGLDSPDSGVVAAAGQAAIKFLLANHPFSDSKP
jgi:hypothetical protein